MPRLKIMNRSGERVLSKRDLKIRIRIFNEEILELPTLRLGVLRLAEERVLEASGDPIDVLMRISEEESRSRKGSYIEVEVLSPETVYIVGESPRYKWRRKLTFKPEQLLKVGVLRRHNLNENEYIRKFNLNDLVWYSIPKDKKVYVFEGVVEPKVDDIVLVVLETAEGRSYLKPVYASKPTKFSQTPR